MKFNDVQLLAIRQVCILLVFAVTSLALLGFSPAFDSLFNDASSRFRRIPANAQNILARCASLKVHPGPRMQFFEREISDRFEPGTNATLIRNATIWTGLNNGTLILYGDLLLENGIVRGIGDIPARLMVKLHNHTIVDAQRAWVTPGLVDLHSHLGLLSAPGLAGALDANSHDGPTLPWLRSVDGFSTHDDALRLAMAGGVTSVQVLPGSKNVIGGQGYMIKLRKTSMRTPYSMLIDPPFTLHGAENTGNFQAINWRHMKQSCGENVRRHGSRMDAVWALRSVYNEARTVKQAQDSFCQKVEEGKWGSLDSKFPENLRLEMLVDVLRGRVKVASHCSEPVDLDAMVRITQEFRFSIASFHSASEAWLVPELLKQTWGGIPGVAVLGTKHREERESYRGSEFAPRVLADNDIPLIMASGHPAVNSRYLVYEAQQAHYFSLPASLALASVTSVPATVAGLSHRIGIIREGADADVVLWDSHPLQLGATPVKVWIDGILQIPEPQEGDGPPSNVVVGRGKEAPVWREIPQVPDWDKERKEAEEWEGLPPLRGRQNDGRIVFMNVKELWTRDRDGGIVETLFSDRMATVVVERGKIICAGSKTSCMMAWANESVETVDLREGTISPGFMAFGSPLGMEEISSEPSTGDGGMYNAFVDDVPQVLGDTGAVVRAVDALQFGTRNALLAHRSGVTLATSSLYKRRFFGEHSGVIFGLSTTFRTGSANPLDKGAIIHEVAALHVEVARSYPYSDDATRPSISQTIAGLRRLLQGWEKDKTETGFWFKQAALGAIPLVIEVSSADIMATLLVLKDEIEERSGSTMKMVFSGATEAHLLASQISDAGVGVILNPLRPYPTTWSDRRILAGPPLSNDTALVKLLEHKVTVGVGEREGWAAQNKRFDITWAAMESNGRLTRREAYELASTNLENLMGLKGMGDEMGDLVAYEGGSSFDLSSKVVAVLSQERGIVDFV